MLVINSLLSSSLRTLGIAVAIGSVIVGSAFVDRADAADQQTPSQRYAPIRQNVYDAGNESERIHREGIQQVGYQQSIDPRVPDILAGPRPMKVTPLSSTPADSNQFAPPTQGSNTTIGGTNETMPRRTPADYATQMGLRQQAVINQPKLPSAPSQETRTAAIPVGISPQVGGPLPQPAVTSTPQRTATTAAANRIDGSNQFRTDLRQPETTNTKPSSPIVLRSTQPETTQAVVAPLPRVEQPKVTPIQDSRIRPATAIEPRTEKATIKIAAPSIEVVTVGPQTIGINKPSEYKVIVRNNSTIDAGRVLVGVDLPAWVDLENLSLTGGSKELTDSTQKARLVWNVDQVPAGSDQTLTITAVPRKAEIFDVGVEWTLVPVTGKTTIRVTEPKLEMTISGPKEVQYGETALYHVAVRNPGTGAAEDVTVMLPEALGGERATLGVIPPGKEKNFQVELLARTAGDLNLLATATADGNLKTSAERALIVRRAKLEISMAGPPLKYAGGIAKYSITINNTGDATATELMAAVALPEGVKYLKGIDAVKLIDGGMRWPVGSLAAGQSRTYEMFCELNTSGDLRLEVGARGKRDLAASGLCQTRVETIADLVLTVEDLKGPLPTGEKVPYKIRIRNRGTKAAQGVNLVMQFSEGIEPHSARGLKGLEHKIVPGKVLFSPIAEIAPGQEVAFEVIAEAYQSGTHIFRAQLTCEDSDAREIAEGTTRYFGDPVEPPSMLGAPAANTANSTENSFQ